MAGLASLFGMRLPFKEISDNEASDAELSMTSAAAAFPIREAKNEIEETQELKVTSENDEDDEYVVETIQSHLVDENGDILYQIKWLGYEKKSDMTWEPEENLETVSEMLDEYLDKVGGKDAILAAFKEKSSKGTKRGRSSGPANGTPAKRGKKPDSSTPPAGAKENEFKPPSGSWEDQVTLIDACEGGEGKVIVYLTWKGGYKTQHPLELVYKRCPQKVR